MKLSCVLCKTSERGAIKTLMCGLERLKPELYKNGLHKSLLLFYRGSNWREFRAARFCGLWDQTSSSCVASGFACCYVVRLSRNLSFEHIVASRKIISELKLCGSWETKGNVGSMKEMKGFRCKTTLLPETSWVCWVDLDFSAAWTTSGPVVLNNLSVYLKSLLSSRRKWNRRAKNKSMAATRRK